MSQKYPLVFLDVSIDGDPIERMVFELFSDVVPKTAENFRALCTGEKGISRKSGRPLHYKGTFFHRILKGYLAEGGDFLKRDGSYGESIYGANFPDESPKLKHDGPGLLSMSIDDRDTRGSLFAVTFKANYQLDRKYVVFGKLVQGHEVLKKIEDAGVEEGRPAVTVKIINCGEFHDGETQSDAMLERDKRKVSKMKNRKDRSSEANSLDVHRRGKHKKSSKVRRKKRRYYTSESDSSSYSESESSESDSDSDSIISSSSDFSSSSDDRRRKRKRSSKRDKYRHGRRDRRREKKHKRHYKRSKRKPIRASDSSTGTESDSENDNINAPVPDGKQKCVVQITASAGANQSPKREDKEVASFHYRSAVATDVLEREESEYPKENGDWQSNGIELENRLDKVSDRQPDIDLPGKSRSRSISPKRMVSKSLSISPRRSLSMSRSLSPRQRISRRRDASESPSISGSPPCVIRRSRSVGRSPVRSESSQSHGRSTSQSPVRGKKGRSVSQSPVRIRSRKSISWSPTLSPPPRTTSHSPPRTSSRKSSWRSESRSPPRVIRRSASRSPRRSSRSSGRAPSRRSTSRSPARAPTRDNRHSYSRSPPVSIGHRVRSRSSSKSLSPDGSPKRIRRGRGFSERYSYARRYRTRSPPYHSPVRSYRFDRYSSYRRSPRRYRSPPRRSPPRYRSRRSRSRSPICYRSRPVRSRSPVETSRYRPSSPVERRRLPPRSRSRSRSRSSSRDSQSPKRASNVKSSRSTSKSRSRSSSGSPRGNNKGLVSYGDGSPDSDQR